MFCAALLAGIAGYVDAICYIHLGGAFAANMTGNLVEAGMRAALGDWLRALWCLCIPITFLLGVVATRFLLRSQYSLRPALLFEAGVIATAGTGLLGLAATPLLAAAMAMQNEAVTHGVVAINVAFITGDLQRLGERLVGGTERRGQRRLILAVLACYACGAAVGTLAAGWGAPALFYASTTLIVVLLLPERWTGLRRPAPSGRL